MALAATVPNTTIFLPLYGDRQLHYSLAQFFSRIVMPRVPMSFVLFIIIVMGVPLAEGGAGSGDFSYRYPFSSYFKFRIECSKAANRLRKRKWFIRRSLVFQNDHYFPSPTNGLRVNAYQIFSHLSRSLGPVWTLFNIHASFSHAWPYILQLFVCYVLAQHIFTGCLVHLVLFFSCLSSTFAREVFEKNVFGTNNDVSFGQRHVDPSETTPTISTRPSRRIHDSFRHSPEPRRWHAPRPLQCWKIHTSWNDFWCA